MLELFKLARITFYYYMKKQNIDKHEKEKQEILDIFNANKSRYGYRRILLVLCKNCVEYFYVQDITNLENL